MGKRAYEKISKYRPSLFQGKFDFSLAGQAGRRGFSLAYEHPMERLMQSGLFAVLIFLACLYLYFITATVLNVIARKDALGKVARIQGSIGGLEQEYFALSGEVNPASAKGLGLAPVSNTSYVYRPGNVGAATIAGNDN